MVKYQHAEDSETAMRVRQSAQAPAGASHEVEGPVRQRGLWSAKLASYARQYRIGKVLGTRTHMAYSVELHFLS